MDVFVYQLKRFTCRDTIWILSIYSKIKKSDCIVIHNRPKVPRLLRALGYKGKIILHMHNSHLYHLNNKTAFLLKNSVDLILYCSNFLKTETLEKFPYLESKSEVIYNGVEDFKQPKKIKNKIILFAGRIIDSKGVIELIRAFNIVKKNHKEYSLHLVGGVTSGDSKQKTQYLVDLEQEISSSSFREDIKFIGYLDHGKLIEEMRNSEVLSVASKWKEPFGMVALEGFTCGCKVVATSNGGMPEILGNFGYYCECEPNSIAQAIEEAILDAEYSFNKKHYERFLWSNISSDFESILLQ
ncbi:glycosyltransferase, partial [Vibrio parahaemolyticus]|nr:glycosyltransferase [Vibrio parahaemolyticus]